MIKHSLAFLLLVLLAGCGSFGGKPRERAPQPSPQAPQPQAETASPAAEPAARKGGYYLDDGPGDGPHPDIEAIPDAVPRNDPPLARANRPYVALGENYVPMTEYQPYQASGVASWYGRRYHGQKTSTGEIYDMYAMTAAHPTLPIPSYVRVTSVDNGRAVVVRVNDRGPFKKNRLIDLSYAAAYKLGLVSRGSGMVEVEAIDTRVPASAAAQPALSLEPALQKAPARAGAYVQVGAFRQKDNAELLRTRIARSGLAQSGEIESWYNDGIHRVRLGPYANRDLAEQAAAQLRQALGLNAIVTLQ